MMTSSFKKMQGLLHFHSLQSQAESGLRLQSQHNSADAPAHR